MYLYSLQIIHPKKSSSFFGCTGYYYYFYILLERDLICRIYFKIALIFLLLIIHIFIYFMPCKATKKSCGFSAPSLLGYIYYLILF